jgi:hypothetical protein
LGFYYHSTLSSPALILAMRALGGYPSTVAPRELLNIKNKEKFVYAVPNT